jgi:hypothetical protein
MVLTRRQGGPDNTNSKDHVPPNTLQHQAMAVAAATKKEKEKAASSSSSTSSATTTSPKTAPWVYILLVSFAIITYVTIPVPLHPQPGLGVPPSIQHVFYYGWLTALSTGLGALPFVLFPDVATFWVGISNGK